MAMEDPGTGRKTQWWIWLAIVAFAIIVVIAVLYWPVDREVPREDVRDLPRTEQPAEQPRETTESPDSDESPGAVRTDSGDSSDARTERTDDDTQRRGDERLEVRTPSVSDSDGESEQPEPELEDSDRHVEHARTLPEDAIEEGREHADDEYFRRRDVDDDTEPAPSQPPEVQDREDDSDHRDHPEVEWRPDDAEPPPTRSRSPRANDDRRQEESTPRSATDDPAGGDSTAQPRSEQAREAFEQYRGVLDDYHPHDPADVATYSAVAARQAAESLYLLSAGELMDEQLAAGQRDDIVAAAENNRVIPTGQAGGDVATDTESNHSDSPGPEHPDQPPGDESDDWTVWEDVADWLRAVQQRDYPHLDELVDDVEAAAAELDADRADTEQIEELIDFYEAVEEVLEAMAAHDQDTGVAPAGS